MGETWCAMLKWKHIILMCGFVLIACAPARMQQPDTAVMLLYKGNAPAVLLIMDGFPLDSLPSGNVARFTVTPGEHMFWAKSEGLFGPPGAVNFGPGEISYFVYEKADRSFKRLDERAFSRRIAADAE
jgi:hypothetical protein